MIPSSGNTGANGHFRVGPLVRIKIHRSIAVALAIFLSTRVIMLVLIDASLILAPANPLERGKHVLVGQPILDGLIRGDALGYLGIAQVGYWFDPSSGIGSAALLPLFPALVSLAESVIPEPGLAALLIANGCLAIALMLVYGLTAERFGDDTAAAACLLLCVFPYSFLLSSAYPQSLVLVLAVLALSCAERRRFWPASACAALAALTMPVGLALWPAVAVAWIRSGPFRAFGPRAILQALSLTVPPAAVALLVVYLRRDVRLPLRSIGDMVFGPQAGLLFDSPPNILASLARGGVNQSFFVSLNLGMAVGALAVTAVASHRQTLPYLLYSLLVVAVSFVGNPTSVGPSLLVAFPIFVAVAALLRTELAQSLVLAGSALLLALLTARFVNWYDVGGAVDLASTLTATSRAVALYDAYRSRLGLTATTTHDLFRTADDFVLLLGATTPQGPVRPGQTVRVPISLYTVRSTEEHYLLSVHVTDHDGHTRASVDHPLWGKADGTLIVARQSPEYAEGRFLVDDLAFTLDPSIPTGVYSMSLLVFKLPRYEPVTLRARDGGSVEQVALPNLIVGRPEDLGSAAQLSPPHTLRAYFGPALALVGYDVRGSQDTSTPRLDVSLFWSALNRPASDYTVFVQLLNATGQLVAQSDSFPVGGRFPTSYLRPGQVLRDDHALDFSKDLTSGTYSLITGLYRLDTGERLPVRRPGTNRIEDHVALQSVTLPLPADASDRRR